MPEAKPFLSVTFDGQTFPDGGAFFQRVKSALDDEPCTLLPTDLLKTIDFWRGYPGFFYQKGETVIRRIEPPVVEKENMLAIVHSEAEEVICAAAENFELDSWPVAESGRLCRNICKAHPEIGEDSPLWIDWAMLRNPTLSEENRTILKDAEQVITRLEAKLRATQWFRYNGKSVVNIGAVEKDEATKPKAGSIKKTRAYASFDQKKRPLILTALCRHHGYEGESIDERVAPISGSQLAKNASTAIVKINENDVTQFFQKTFGGHREYRFAVGRIGKLKFILQQLNDELAPWHVAGIEDTEGIRGDRHHKPVHRSEYDDGVRN